MPRRKRRPARRFPVVSLVLFVVVIGLVVYARTTVVSRAVRHAHVAQQSPATTSALNPADPPAAAEPAAAESPAAERPGLEPTSSAVGPSPSAPANAFPNAAATTAPAAAAHSESPEPGQSPRSDGAPQVAIIIDDCGQWLDTERGFIALPIPLTLSVLPHVHGGVAIAGEADAAGKGVMLHLPMETVSGRDPGPGQVTTAMSDDAIATILADDFATVPHATGVNNHEGSRATANTRVMDAIAGVLAQDKRFFVDSRTSAQSVAEAEAHRAGVPTARRNIFLDDTDDLAAIETQLLAAASFAHDHGSAIAIGHPRANTLAALRAMYPRMQADGIEFALVSTLVH